MQTTIFETPVINTMCRWISSFILRMLGWKVVGSAPDEPKYVVIAAPHTSNWDFPYTLMVCFALRLRVHWMGKASLFPPILGGIMRWLGGIAVDREQAGHVVPATIAAFNRCHSLSVIIPPEGTRGQVTAWKSGFYRIATGARVPIAMAYLDFKKREGGIGHIFWPTGDMEKDMAEIQKFYEGITGKHPHRFSSDSIRTRS
ncbi:MAG: glycerol acyltransferase [Pseudomonadales bacterium]|nr:glycerol acyltransferase [Pseudomonadales bacterium]